MGAQAIEPDASHWFALGVAFAAIWSLDLFVHRGGRATSRGAALGWSAVWIGAGLAFGGYVWIALGSRAAEEYLAAYLIEESLSVDNLFVFLMIFAELGISRERQHQVLSWGILGALVFRALFILGGVAALQRWDWLRWILGGLLLSAAWRAARKQPDPQEDNRLTSWLSEHLPLAGEDRGGHFFVRQRGKLRFTPLLVALCAIELTDIAFAIDSIPAALSVTRNKFVVYSSNGFAVLGLRALYLVVADALGRLRYLHYGLAFVLAFAAFKILAEDWLPIEPLVSVGIIASGVGLSVWASLHYGRSG